MLKVLAIAYLGFGTSLPAETPAVPPLPVPLYLAAAKATTAAGCSRGGCEPAA